MGPYFFKLWYKLHGNIPFQYSHLTYECGHGQMCHAKQRLATDHCSLRGLWFTCITCLSTNLLQSLPYLFCRYFLLSYVITLRRIRYRIRCLFGCKSNFVSAEQALEKGNEQNLSARARPVPPSLFCFRCPPFVKLGMLYENERRCEFSQRAVRLKDISG